MRLIAPALIIAAVGIAIPGVAADRRTPDQQLAQKLAGLTPGAPTECIHSYPERPIGSFGNKILYQVGPRFFYVNETGGGCERLERGDRLVTISVSGRPCQGDIARTVRPEGGMITGSCTLGTFTPYQR